MSALFCLTFWLCLPAVIYPVCCRDMQVRSISVDGAMPRLSFFLLRKRKRKRKGASTHLAGWSMRLPSLTRGLSFSSPHPGVQETVVVHYVSPSSSNTSPRPCAWAASDEARINLGWGRAGSRFYLARAKKGEDSEMVA